MTNPVVLIATNDPHYGEKLRQCAVSTVSDVDWVLPGEKAALNASVAACWYPQSDLVTQYPALRCLHSVGAGSDNLGSLLSTDLEVRRIVDQEQKVGMFEYILWGIIYYQRDMDRYLTAQNSRQWQAFQQRRACDTRVGILGLGEIGGYVASRLAEMGYQVSGWSRTAKRLRGVQSYSGVNGVNTMLGELDILVNLLPLNEQTEGILNRALLSRLPKRAALIHCGRGSQLVEQDLIDLLDNEQLRGSILDVFTIEPLPESSKLWSMDKVLVTPHIASSASIPQIVRQISATASELAQQENR